jgi:2,3-bisphosphoglycerate-dependent phosphoglycerate mutase
MTQLLLVRHGDALWSPDEMRPLSPLGRGQAESVAETLAPMKPTAIYSSPWTRARQTVEPLAARLQLPITLVADLRERLLADRAVGDFVAASYATWDDFSFAHAGGESNAAAQQRAVAAIGTIAARHAAARVVVATHGTLLALILNAYDPSIGVAFWQRLATPDIYSLDLARTPAVVTRVLGRPDVSP